MAATMRCLTDVKGCAASRPACSNKRAAAVAPRAVHGLRNSSSSLSTSSSTQQQHQLCSSAAPLQSRRAAQVTRVAAQEAPVEAAKGTQVCVRRLFCVLRPPPLRPALSPSLARSVRLNYCS